MWQRRGWRADEHDVVVVGGRIGGCLTAAHLAARGLRVLVLESRSFPSATVSTHVFRGDGLVRALAEVGVLDEVLATGPPPFRGELFFVDDATEPLSTRRRSRATSASVSRSGARRWTRSWPVGWRRHQVSPAVRTPRWSGSCTTPVA